MFIVLITAVGLVVVSAFDWLTRAAIRGYLLALLGLVLLVNFILIRSSLFHHVDVLTGLRLGGLKQSWMASAVWIWPRCRVGVVVVMGTLVGSGWAHGVAGQGPLRAVM